jgi:hypothetical protein
MLHYYGHQLYTLSTRISAVSTGGLPGHAMGLRFQPCDISSLAVSVQRPVTSSPWKVLTISMFMTSIREAFFTNPGFNLHMPTTNIVERRFFLRHVERV